MNASDFPKTLQAAIEFFADEQRCHDFFVAMRWPNGVECPHCNSKEVGTFSGKRRVSNCKNCGKQFTAKVRSIFSDSPLPLKTWLMAMWMIINAKNGVSSHELHRELGITQKSAWFVSHRIRLALHEGNFEMMKGRVEADETFIGAKARNMQKDKGAEKITGTGGAGKTAVMGLLERSQRKRASRVKLAVLQSTKRGELHGMSANSFCKAHRFAQTRSAAITACARITGMTLLIMPFVMPKAIFTRPVSKTLGRFSSVPPKARTFTSRRFICSVTWMTKPSD